MKTAQITDYLGVLLSPDHGNMFIEITVFSKRWIKMPELSWMIAILDSIFLWMIATWDSIWLRMNDIQVFTSVGLFLTWMKNLWFWFLKKQKNGSVSISHGLGPAVNCLVTLWLAPDSSFFSGFYFFNILVPVLVLNINGIGEPSFSSGFRTRTQKSNLVPVQFLVTGMGRGGSNLQCWVSTTPWPNLDWTQPRAQSRGKRAKNWPNPARSLVKENSPPQKCRISQGPTKTSMATYKTEQGPHQQPLSWNIQHNWIFEFIPDLFQKF